MRYKIEMILTSLTACFSFASSRKSRMECDFLNVRTTSMRYQEKKGEEETVRKLFVAATILSVFTLVAVIDSFAQCGPAVKEGGGGPSLGTRSGMGSPYQPLYDPKKVERISGTVENTEKVVPVQGAYSAVQIMLRADNETIAVRLGPEWYIRESGMKLEAGDTVEVKGSRGLLAGKPVIVAAEIRNGGTTLVLRSDIGVPAWSDWRLRR